VLFGLPVPDDSNGNGTDDDEEGIVPSFKG
jgi:hypothetical protein